MVEVRNEQKKMSGRNYTPSVIEPSFGIGRIIYCMFEHCYYTREGEGNEARSVFKFTPVVAPVKATVFPLVQKEGLNAVARQVGRVFGYFVCGNLFAARCTV
jgi:glycyl-tRNA synthetase